MAIRSVPRFRREGPAAPNGEGTASLMTIDGWHRISENIASEKLMIRALSILLVAFKSLNVQPDALADTPHQKK